MNQKPVMIAGMINLSIAILGLWAFVFLLAPAILKINAVQNVSSHSMIHNIDATALFYTDSESFNGVDVILQDSLKRNGKE